MTAGMVATARAQYHPDDRSSALQHGSGPDAERAAHESGLRVTVGPATVDLGDIPCGSVEQRLASAKITVSNYGGSGNSFNVGGAGQFTISPSSGSLPAPRLGSPTMPGVQILTVTTRCSVEQSDHPQHSVQHHGGAVRH